MNKMNLLGFCLSLILLIVGCEPPAAKVEGPAVVKVVNTEGKYSLTVNGQAYEVKGAGLDFKEGTNFKSLKEAGGNTYRSWSTTNLAQELDSAKKYGIMAAVGLDLGKELHEFDYTDEAAVAAQFAKVKKVIDTYKDHPNILCWVAGNEMNLLFDEKGQLKLVNPKTYTALAQIVDYIHEVDTNHPVTTTFAGVTQSHIDLALSHCPNLDFLGFQVYGGLGAIPQLVADAQVSLPYMVTEFGPMGHWEMPSTAWGREIEEPSASKAVGLAARMQQGLSNDKSGMNIGSFAFLWGQKQERTPTWYGMFNKSGEANARIDEMTKYWSGTYPENRAPLTDSMKLDNKEAVENIYLKPNTKYVADVFVRELNGDPIDYKWVMLKEVDVRSEGGALEKEPEPVNFEIIADAAGKLEFVSPSEEGDYRIFSYAYDGKGKVGNANIPFYVKK